MKRVMDVVLALTGLILGAPLMAAVALAVKLDSRGKIIYSQPRLGQYGRIFHVHKFRKFPDSWREDGPAVTVAGDARLTRLGSFLERSKLDELPQLWNILCGDMSFVGPRPESVRFADLFAGEFARVLDFVPGIFGPNQAAFRNESEMYPADRDPEQFYREELFPQKARADIAYFTKSNVLYDLRWIIWGIMHSILGAFRWRRIITLYGLVVLLDILVLELAWLGANFLRFAGPPEHQHMDVYVTGTWLLPLTLVPFMIAGGCYRQPVHQFSVGDALRITIANTLGWAMAYLVVLGLFHRNGSILLAPLGLLLTLPMMWFPRIWHREQWRRQAHESAASRVTVVIYGAGRRGSALVSLFDQGFANVHVAGFLDDDEDSMRGRMIMGRKILGSERDLNTIFAVTKVDQIWTTFDPNIHKFKRLKHWCDDHGVRLVVLPLTEPFASLCQEGRDIVVEQSGYREAVS